jgi:hypothetical protein
MTVPMCQMDVSAHRPGAVPATHITALGRSCTCVERTEAVMCEFCTGVLVNQSGPIQCIVCGAPIRMSEPARIR